MTTPTPGQATPPPPELITRDQVLQTIKAKKNELQRLFEEAMRKADMYSKTIFELNKLQDDIERFKPYRPPLPSAPVPPTPPMTPPTAPTIGFAALSQPGPRGRGLPDD